MILPADQPRQLMTPSKPFATKLNLVLKALNISRGRLAAELGVDKSLTGRWASGAVMPSAHNLAKLTVLIASRCPGFTLLDWDRDIASLMGLFGVDPGSIQAAVEQGFAGSEAENGPVLPFAAVQAAREATARRGVSYEGLWRVTQPAFAQPGRLVHTHCLIRRKDGLLQMMWGAPGWLCTGWLLIVMGQLFGMLVNGADDTILFCILNGVSMPRVNVLDGLMLTNAKDGQQTPTTAACMLERIADLSGDPVEDERRYERLREAPDGLCADNVSEEIRTHLLRDIGPSAFAAGGDLLLSAPVSRSLSRGSPSSGW